MKEYIKNFIVFDILLIVIAYGTVFNQLDRQPINDWDEGIYTTNALEMSFNSNYLVKYYLGQPDMFAFEPPLAAWVQTLSIKIFGISETAHRIPSGIAAILVVVLIINFCSKELKNRILGYLSSFVLLTSPGYVGYHVVRTADLDSLLVLFTTLYVFNFYKYLKYTTKKNFYFALIGVVLSFLTKSFAGLIMLLPLFIFTIYKKKLKLIFINKELYIGILLFLIIIPGYYLLRENISPGYIKAVLKVEISDRFLTNMGHEAPFLYYFNNIKDYRFSPWLVLILLSIFITIYRKGIIKNEMFIYFTLVAISYWLIISSAGTKLEWYDAQLYPFISIAAGYSIYIFYVSGYNFHSQKKIGYYIYSIIFVIAIFYYPFNAIISKNASKDFWREAKYGVLMKKAKEMYPQIKSYKVLTIGLQPSPNYYCQLFNLKYHYNVRPVNVKETMNFLCCDTILFTHPAIYEKLNKDFYYTIVDQYQEAALVIVDSLKRK